MRRRGPRTAADAGGGERGASTSARPDVVASDDDNRLPKVVAGATTAFEYERKDSATRKTAEATTTTYAWDGARRLKDVKLNGTSWPASATTAMGRAPARPREGRPPATSTTPAR